MSEDRVTRYVVAWNCMTCGTLLHGDYEYETQPECQNCGAGYSINGDLKLARYYKGRPPTQWRSSGWDGETQKPDTVH